MIQRRDVQLGMVVRSSDGVQVGRVIGIEEDGLVVEKGAFFVHDYLIPFREVRAVSGEDLHLTQSREHLARIHREGIASTMHPEDRLASVDATGALSLGPTDLDEARMDSTKFQDHERYLREHERYQPLPGALPVDRPALHAAPSGGLGLSPTDLTEARMDSAKFQDHGRYDVGASGEAGHEHLGAERRASGPGWDALGEDEKEAPRTGGPLPTDPKTRY